MRNCDVAQAAEFVRALKQQLHEMTVRLAWVEQQGVTGAMQLEAAALRLDIQEAQFLIDGLRRRYLNGDGGPASQVVMATGQTERSGFPGQALPSEPSRAPELSGSYR
jgi:hypothetical protein